MKIPDKEISLFDEWSSYIIKVLNAEFDYTSMIKHSSELGNARETLIKGVLQRIIPKTYEIGSGMVIDSKRNLSKQIDVIIARQDFPSMQLPHGSKIYLVESVLATIEVKSQLTSESLHKSLDNCASVSELIPVFTITEQGKKKCEYMGLERTDDGDWAHPTDDSISAKFRALRRPSSYIFGFNGYVESSIHDFKDSISLWANNRKNEGKPLILETIPSVVATKGCFACRNFAPFENTDNQNLCLIGKDNNPIRLIITHLLYTLINKVSLSPDSNGLIPELLHYIQNTSANLQDGLFSWPVKQNG